MIRTLIDDAFMDAHAEQVIDQLQLHNNEFRANRIRRVSHFFFKDLERRLEIGDEIPLYEFVSLVRTERGLEIVRKGYSDDNERRRMQ